MLHRFMLNSTGVRVLLSFCSPGKTVDVWMMRFCGTGLIFDDDDFVVVEGGQIYGDAAIGLFGEGTHSG